jgi:hypothetical protein
MSEILRNWYIQYLTMKEEQTWLSGTLGNKTGYDQVDHLYKMGIRVQD